MVDVHFTGDGKILACRLGKEFPEAGAAQFVAAWRFPDLKERYRRETPAASIVCGESSRFTAYVRSGKKWETQVFDLGSGKRKSGLRLGDERLKSGAFVPGTRWLVRARDRGKVRVYDTKSGVTTALGVDGERGLAELHVLDATTLVSRSAEDGRIQLWTIPSQ